MGKIGKMFHSVRAIRSVVVSYRRSSTPRTMDTNFFKFLNLPGKEGYLERNSKKL